MANVTLEPGYLPECSGLEPYDFSEARAASVDFRSGIYYVDLLPTTVPAIVFGCLAAIGMVFYLVWMCVQHRRTSRRRAREVEAAKAQFAATPTEPQTVGSGSSPAAPPAAPLPPEQRQQQPARGLAACWGRLVQRSERGTRMTWGRALKAFIVLLSLGLIGVSGWGIAESIKASNETISNFWNIVDVAEEKMIMASDTLQVLDDQLGNISYALGVTSSAVQDIPPLVMLIPGVRDVVKVLQTAPADAKATIDSVQKDVQGAIAGINDAGLGTIARLRGDYYYWTSQLEDTWRFVAIAVVFGLAIIFTALAMVLVVRMKWEKWASFSVALLWLIVVVLMFLGVGLLKGAYKVSEDGCLYAEAFALRVVNETVTPESSRDTALKAMNYYFGFYDIPDNLVVYELFGAPTHTIHEVMEGPVGAILDILESGSGVLNTILNAVGVSKQDSETILSLVQLAPETIDTVTELERQVNRANIEPVYFQFKEWVCCDLRSTIYDIWEAWTVAGVLGWVLSALCSARVMLHTLGVRQGLSKRSGVSLPLAELQPSINSKLSPNNLEKSPPASPPAPPPLPDSGAPPSEPEANIELASKV